MKERKGLSLDFNDDGEVAGIAKARGEDAILSDGDCMGVRCEHAESFVEFQKLPDGGLSKIVCTYSNRSPFEIMKTDGICPLKRWYMPRCARKMMMKPSEKDLLVRHGDDWSGPEAECHDSACGSD